LSKRRFGNGAPLLFLIGSRAAARHNFRMSRKTPFILVDVFTSRPFGGNQLAVFTDGAALSASEMQELAHEMNLRRAAREDFHADTGNSDGWTSDGGHDVGARESR
jgi:hypothetical protein